MPQVYDPGFPFWQLGFSKSDISSLCQGRQAQIGAITQVYDPGVRPRFALRSRCTTQVYAPGVRPRFSFVAIRFSKSEISSQCQGRQAQIGAITQVYDPGLRPRCTTQVCPTQQVYDPGVWPRCTTQVFLFGS
jgi:hypothetical protein